MQKIVVANWKMNGSVNLAQEIASALKLQSFGLDIQLVICPPFVLIPFFANKLKHNSDIHIGAQDVSSHESGAYTGEISANMLKEAGCKFAIIGHSERRTYHKEDNDLVLAKIEQVMKAGLTPIVCIGESLADRQANNTEAVLSMQLDPILAKYKDAFYVAYEPVWAIGTGVAATTKEIKETHGFLRKKLYNCPTVPLLYGGSVNGANAESIMSLKDVDGVLVGGASLKVNEMTEICAAANRCSE